VQRDLMRVVIAGNSLWVADEELFQDHSLVHYVP
jgi:hypothetical protein